MLYSARYLKDSFIYDANGLRATNPEKLFVRCPVSNPEDIIDLLNELLDVWVNSYESSSCKFGKFADEMIYYIALGASKDKLILVARQICDSNKTSSASCLQSAEVKAKRESHKRRVMESNIAQKKAWIYEDLLRLVDEYDQFEIQKEKKSVRSCLP